MTDITPFIPARGARLSGRGGNPVLGIGLRLFSAAAISVMFVLVKLAADADVHLAESLFWRQLTGLPMVLGWLWMNNDLANIKPRKPSAHFIRMMLGLSAMVLNFWSMTLLPMAEATTIAFAMPIFATMLAALLLKESAGIYRWGAILLGFVGVLLAAGPAGSGIAPLGAAIGILGALIGAGVTIQLRLMARSESTGAIVFWFSLWSLLPLGIAMYFFAQPHTAMAWGYIAGLSIAGALAQIALTAALRHASVAAISTMDYSSLIWAIIFGFLIFDTAPGVGVWLGAPVIIFAGIFIAWREHYLAKKRVSMG